MASRRKRRASRALDAAPVAGEPGPLPGWREVLRRPAFRAAALRQALPVIGVFFLRWPAVDIVAFFLLEVWLFLTLRFAFEVTVGDEAMTHLTPTRLASEVLKHALVGGAVFALMVGMVVLVTVMTTFPHAQLADFVRRGWRTPSFVLALALMLASHLWEARDFALRVRSRSADERRSDDVRIRVMLGRLALVGLAGFFIGGVQAVGLGGPILVLVISAAIVWLEAAPERADRMFGFAPRRAA